MAYDIQSPARAAYLGISGETLFWLINLSGVALFFFILFRRLQPLIHGQSNRRVDRPIARTGRLLKYWLAQWKHPRYRTAGALHILLFTGFITLVIRAFSLLFFGICESCGLVTFPGIIGTLYDGATQYATTVVFLCVIFAIVRRLLFQPKRYAVPPEFGGGRKADAIFLLVLIGILMFADAIFEASALLIEVRGGLVAHPALPGTLTWVLASSLFWLTSDSVYWLYRYGYLAHVVTFYVLLCYRPFGIQFHVETSLFNIFFAKLDREQLKPVRWQATEEQIVNFPSLGVKKFLDFTWKQMLDFYSCADCGRCSDQCPSNATGRPLSPRFLSIKARDYSFQHHPVFSRTHNGQPLVGSIYSEDEIWSCTTCGACEEECPLLVEHIDKIVDLRRGLVDDGNLPAQLQKPLKSIQSRGNPYGKLEKRRADWTLEPGFAQKTRVSVANGKSVHTLYFVDSITSYDDRMQSIARATARILATIGEDFAILGSAERDSGHEVRRFGEETLFFSLRDHNTEKITATKAQSIVTADPHAFNALKRDYNGLPPVEHICQVVRRALKDNKIRFTPIEPGNVYTFHDPCYLGRHNHLYDPPREVLDAVPGLNRVEMKRCRDRSFCCGGGGLALFYEPKEDERMAVMRVRMAAEAGANVIVTACPFCLTNIEDAIKVGGLEGQLSAIDLAELTEKQLLPTGVAGAQS